MEQSAELGSFLQSSAEAIGIRLHQAQIDSFLIYLDQLKQWNQVINLTGITKDREIIVKHFIDSLAGLLAEPLIHHASLADIGTGAGFPGIPLKLARPDLSLTLVEPVNKKVSFLRFLIGTFHLERVSVFEGTVDQFINGQAIHQLFDYVTTRAIRYDEVTKYFDRLLNKHGKALLYLAEPIDQRSLSRGLSVDHEFAYELPEKYGKRSIATISIKVDTTECSTWNITHKK